MPITCHELRRYALREHSYRNDWGLERRYERSPEFMLR
jgi:hypothetical protein